MPLPSSTRKEPYVCLRREGGMPLPIPTDVHVKHGRSHWWGDHDSKLKGGFHPDNVPQKANLFFNMRRGGNEGTAIRS